MKLVTGAYELIEEGDKVGIVRFDEEADETIYVGTVQENNDGHLETSIPGDEQKARYEILGLDDGSRYAIDEAEEWFNRFDSSEYMLYLKSEKRSSGDIRIDGV